MALSEEDRRRIEEEEFRKEARERAQRQLDAGGSSANREAPSTTRPPPIYSKTAASAERKPGPADALRGAAVVCFIIGSVGGVLSGNPIAFSTSVAIAIFLILCSLSFKPK